MEHTKNDKKTISLTINGAPEQVPAGDNLKDYLERKGLAASRVVCELNEKIVKRSDLEKAALAEGDILEVITMMGGG